MAARGSTGRRRARGSRVRALVAALLGATVLALGPTPTPAPAAVTESVDGPVGYFSIGSPTAQTVTVSNTAKTSVTVLGTGGVPASGVSAVTANVTVNTPASSTGLYLWPNTSSMPTGTAMQYTSGASRSTLVTTQVGTDGKIALQTGAGASTSVTVVVVGFHALQQQCWGTCYYHNRFSPAQGSTLYDGVARPGAAGAVLTETSPTQQIPIHGVAGVTTAADQAVVRVSVLSDAPVTTAVRRVDVRAGGATSTPTTGQISFFGNTTPSRVLTVPIASGRIDLLVPDTTGNDGANLRVVVDLLGSIDGTAYSPATTGAHASGLLPDVTLTHGAAATDLDLRAAGGLPAAYSSFSGAVVLDVTVKGATQAGRVSLDAAGTIAHVAFGAGAGVVAENQVIVPVVSGSASVPLRYTASSGSGTRTATVEVDYVGSYQFGSYGNPGTHSGDLFTAVPRAGLYDQTLAASATDELQVAGRAGVPATGVSRVALAVHSLSAAGTTDVTLAGKDRPLPADPQVATSVSRSSTLVFVEPGTDGKVQLKVGAAGTRVAISVLGWFTPYAGNGPQDRSVALVGDTLTDEVDDDVMALVDQEVGLNSYGLPSSARAEGLAHWADTSALSRPSKVILNLGTFDAKNGSNSAADTRDRILDHLAGYEAAPCRFVVTVNARTASFATRAAAINTALKGAATPDSRIGVIDWDAYLAATGTTGLVGTDGLPTATGYSALAALYAEAISGDGTGAEAAYVTPCSSTASFFSTELGTPLDPAADPDLTISTDDFTWAGDCVTVTSGTTRDPLLMVGSGAGDSLAWRTSAISSGLLAGAGTVCALTVPGDPTAPSPTPFMTGDQADFTRSAQHVVAAIREMATASGASVDVLAHSRGGFDLRWALRWWPDLRALVDDAVLVGVPNHGSRGNMYVAPETGDTDAAPDGTADNASIPALQQSRADSLFEMALNSMDETPGAIDYTNLASEDDYDSVGATTVDTRTHAWMLDGATNVLVQDHCAVTLTRPDVPSNTWVWAAIHDALGHDGPASGARIGQGTCAGGTTSDPPPTPASTLTHDAEPPLPDHVPMLPETDEPDNPFSPPLPTTDPGSSTRTLDEPGLITDPEDFVDQRCVPSGGTDGPLLLLDGGLGQGGPSHSGSVYDSFLDAGRLTGDDIVCWLELPASSPPTYDEAAVDLERGAQHVVNAVRAMEAETGETVDIVSHSRAGFDVRWALKWWPDTQAIVDDVVMLGTPQLGSRGQRYSACPPDPNGECYRFMVQSRSDSRFMAALQIGDQTPGAVSYTTIGSWDDGATSTRGYSVTGAPLDDRQYTWRVPGASNIVVQQHCAGARVDHGDLLTDDWVWAAIDDALGHAGEGADPSRFVPATACEVADFHPYATVVGPSTVIPIDPADEPVQDYVWQP